MTHLLQGKRMTGERARGSSQRPGLSQEKRREHSAGAGARSFPGGSRNWVKADRAQVASRGREVGSSTEPWLMA